MSYTPTPQQPPTKALDATTPTSLSGIVIALLIPAITIVGLFVLIGTNHLDANVGVPIIAGIAGVHGGAVVANSSSGG